MWDCDKIKVEYKLKVLGKNIKLTLNIIITKN